MSSSQQRKRHPSEESDDDSVENYIPSPPDGGWGWVIVVSSLVCNIIVDGIGYSFGIFLLEFMDYFKESKFKTSLVGSLLCGTYLCVGPIVSALTNKFGCRPVCIAGSIFATCAFVLATFAPSINMLIVTYGIMGGIGFGLIYLPSVVSVGYYFEKKRALATGIAVCGSGIGTFIFAPLTKYLLDVYNWKNALFIVAGIILNGAICGMLMRPLEPVKKKKRKRHGKKRDGDSSKSRRIRSESECNRDTTKILVGVRDAKLLREKYIQENESEIASLPSAYFIKDKGRTQKLSFSDKDGASYPGSPNSLPRITLQDTDSVMSDVTNREMPESPTGTEITQPETPIPDLDNDNINAESPLVNAIRQRKSDEVSNGRASSLVEKTPLLLNNERSQSLKDKHTGKSLLETTLTKRAPSRDLSIPKGDYARPLYKKDIFYSGSVLNIPQFRSQPDMRSYITSITTIPGTFGPDDESPCWKYICIPKSAKDTLREMLDFSLLSNPAFVLICIGNIFSMIGFYIPFVYTVDRAIKLGIDESSATFLLSVIGITNTIGRVLAGWLADRPWCNSLVLNNTAMLISGVATILSPFCMTYIPIVIFAAVFGLCIAAFISLTSIILCELLGLEKLTNAFGLVTLARGISSIAGPPIAGAIYDATGSFDIPFYLSGSMIVMGSLLHFMLFIPWVKRKSFMYEMPKQGDVNLEMENEVIAVIEVENDSAV